MEVDSESQESVSITFEWTLKGLKSLFDSTKGDSKSKVTKSLRFGGGRWQVRYKTMYADRTTADRSGRSSSTPTQACRKKGAPRVALLVFTYHARFVCRLSQSLYMPYLYLSSPLERKRKQLQPILGGARTVSPLMNSHQTLLSIDGRVRVFISSALKFESKGLSPIKRKKYLPSLQRQNTSIPQ
jgi:hypothetical protein